MHVSISPKSKFVPGFLEICGAVPSISKSVIKAIEEEAEAGTEAGA